MTRDLRVLAGIVGVSAAADLLVFVALTLHVHGEGGGPWALAALVATTMVPQVLFAPVGGAGRAELIARRLTDAIALGLLGDGERLAQLEAQWRIENEERTYPMPRRDSHAWLAITGPATPEMLAKLCAVDLRLSKFADLAIAQTSIAKMSAIVVRADIGPNPVFHLLADSAAALYFCECLMDAAEEFGGRIVGLKTLQDLERA